MNEDPLFRLITKLFILNTIMKTKELINADIFIIPNPSIKYPKEIRPYRVNLWQRIIDQHYATKESVDDELTDIENEEFVEVWYVTRKDGYENSQSNWFDHDIDGYSELLGFRPVTNYLPKSLFDGHKEGDIITFPLVITGCGLSMSKEYQEAYNKFINDEISAKEYRKTLNTLKKSIDLNLEVRTSVKISARLAQKDYRYKRFGSFEETLKKICD